MINSLYTTTAFTSRGVIKDAVIRIYEGRIVDVIPYKSMGGETVDLDRNGLIALPGFIDAHVHLNEPGRSHWEGIAKGTSKALLGGTTTVLDMPIDSSPPTLSEEDVFEKLSLFDSKSQTNYGVFAGVVPTRLHEMKRAWKAGAIAFKGFLSPTGWDDFAPLDHDSLLQALSTVKDLGATLALHAEDPICFEQRGSEVIRTPRSELCAVQKAIDGATLTGAIIHLVHLSTSEAVELAQSQANVTTETCPHYFLEDRLLKEFDWYDISVQPPVRDNVQRSRLRDLVAKGNVDVIASDHSPSPPLSDEFSGTWAGTEGIGKTVLALLRQYNDPALVAQYIQQSAKAFAIKNRGDIRPGNFADLITVEHQSTGAWRVVDVIIGGTVVVSEGSIVDRAVVDNVALSSERLKK